MNQDELAEFKKILNDERKLLLNKLSHYNSFGLNENMNDSIGELSGYDNHPGDIGTELFERGKDIALLENEQHILELINEALERIEKNEYGFCYKCNKEIPLERLKVIPYAKYCIEHQPNDSVSLQRPIEEQLLGVPFRKKENEEHLFIEDTWSAVADYGTSSSIDYDPYNNSDRDDESIDNEFTEGFIITDGYGNPVEE